MYKASPGNLTGSIVKWRLTFFSFEAAIFSKFPDGKKLARILFLLLLVSLQRMTS